MLDSLDFHDTRPVQHKVKNQVIPMNNQLTHIHFYQALGFGRSSSRSRCSARLTWKLNRGYEGEPRVAQRFVRVVQAGRSESSSRSPKRDHDFMIEQYCLESKCGW